MQKFPLPLQPKAAAKFSDLNPNFYILGSAALQATSSRRLLAPQSTHGKRGARLRSSVEELCALCVSGGETVRTVTNGDDQLQTQFYLVVATTTCLELGN